MPDTKVFIGGSRRLSRLNADLRRRIDGIIDKGLPIVVGDANGADKAVQRYQGRIYRPGYRVRDHAGRESEMAIFQTVPRRT